MVRNYIFEYQCREWWSEKIFKAHWSSIYQDLNKKNKPYITKYCKNWIKIDKSIFSLFCIQYYGNSYDMIDYENAEVTICIYKFDDYARRVFSENN